MTKRVLVIGGTGTVGSNAVKSLIERGTTPRALVRSAARAATLPGGCEHVIGDSLDRASLDAAAEGVDHVVFVAPHATYEDELCMSDNVIAVCHARKLPLVYFSVGLPGETRIVRFLLSLLIGVFFPHYWPRIRIAQRVFWSPVRPLVVGSGAFCQITDAFIDDILAGSYPEPAGGANKGMPRAHAADMGALIARVVMGPNPPGRRVFGVEGPEVVNGVTAAAMWSEALGRPVTYAGDKNTRWRAALAEKLDEPKLTQSIKTIRVMPLSRFPVSKKRLADTTEMLGRPPLSYRDYVREKVEQLRAEGRV